MTDFAPTHEDSADAPPQPTTAYASATQVGPLRLLLWGAGPAHMRFLKSLQKNPVPQVEITLLTQHTQVFQPRRMAGYIANEYALTQCLTDVEQLLRGTGVRWAGRQGRAMNAAARTVKMDDKRLVEYDMLSINLGDQPNRKAVERAIPGAREHGLSLPPLEGFISMWPKICDLGRSRALRITVVGHCDAGFELALAVRQRMPAAAVTWVPAPHEPPLDCSDALKQRMLSMLRLQRVTVLYDPVAALARNEVVLSSGAQLTCDVPLLVLAQATAVWLQDTGLAHGPGNAPTLGLQILTDEQQRSISHPEVFFVQQDSLVLEHNLRASMAAEPFRLRPVQPARVQFLYAGAAHALAHWRGHCVQGRWVGWMKQLLGA